MSSRKLRHGRVELALWNLRAGSSPVRPLLLLHELGGRSPAVAPPEAEGWPGPVWALDFTGHGGSTVPAGGGYTAEILMADADVALTSLGEVTVAGWGLGAYIAVLIAGARPALVKGTVVGDGHGIEGGGPLGGSMLMRPLFEPGSSPRSLCPPRACERRPASEVRRVVCPPGGGDVRRRRPDRGRGQGPAAVVGRGARLPRRGRELVLGSPEPLLAGPEPRPARASRPKPPDPFFRIHDLDDNGD